MFKIYNTYKIKTLGHTIQEIHILPSNIKLTSFMDIDVLPNLRQILNDQSIVNNSIICDSDIFHPYNETTVVIYGIGKTFQHINTSISYVMAIKYRIRDIVDWYNSEIQPLTIEIVELSISKSK